MIKEQAAAFERHVLDTLTTLRVPVFALSGATPRRKQPWTPVLFTEYDDTAGTVSCLIAWQPDELTIRQSAKIADNLADVDAIGDTYYAVLRWPDNAPLSHADRRAYGTVAQRLIAERPR